MPGVLARPEQREGGLPLTFSGMAIRPPSQNLAWGFGFRISGLGFQGLGVSGLGFRGLGVSGFRGQGLVFRVSGLGFSFSLVLEFKV